MDWNNDRIGVFTASRISELLITERGGKGFGQKAMLYIYEVLSEILTGESKPEVFSKSLEWGNTYEPYAMAEYRKRFGKGDELKYFGKENPVFFSMAPEFQCGGSPDGLIYGEKVIEIKCPYSTSIHLENLSLDVDTFKKERKEYFAQCQMNMICTDTNVADFVSYDPRLIKEDLMIKVLEVPIDYEFCNHLMNRINEASEVLRNLYKQITS